MSLRDKTRAYIELRANQSAVPLEALALDLDPEDTRKPDPVEVSIIWEGSLDEDFYMSGLYAINVADWIGELLLGESTRASGSEFQILVNEYAYEDAGPQIYSLTEIGAASGTEAPPEWYESTKAP